MRRHAGLPSAGMTHCGSNTRTQVVGIFTTLAYGLPSSAFQGGCHGSNAWRGNALSRSGKPKIMQKIIARLLADESGATAIEYGLIASLISVAIIGAASTLGKNLGGTFNNVANNMTTK